MNGELNERHDLDSCYDPDLPFGDCDVHYPNLFLEDWGKEFG
jgi:hypothetical protein